MSEAKKHGWIGLGLTLLVTAVFWIFPLDLRLESLAYSPGAVHWPYNDRQPWAWLYHFGTLPGLALVVAAALGWGLSYGSPKRAHWRYPCLYLVVLLALGPGFLINIVGKGLMGRPRPDETLAFGGTWDYLRPFELGVPGRGRSFLCGHCSMGFLLFGLFYLARGLWRWLALAAALLLGFGLGVARVCQGAHFPSDVLLCGSLLFTLAAAFSPLARKVPEAGKAWGKGRSIAVTGGLVAAIVTAFLFSTPVYEEQEHQWFDPAALPASKGILERQFVWDPATRTALVQVDRGVLRVEVRPQAAALTLHSLVTGFGFPNAKSRIEALQAPDGALEYRQTLHGLFVEAHGAFTLSLAAGRGLRLQPKIQDPKGRLELDLRSLDQAVRLEGLDPAEPLPPGFVRDGMSGALKPGRGPTVEIDTQGQNVVFP